MADTPRLGLTLLEAAQAQKHVTVNEALLRIDALAPARVEGLDLALPPASPAEGTVWGIGSGAGGDWAGQDGRLALALGGGWSFADAAVGATVWNGASGSRWTRTASGWAEQVAASSPGGALTLARIAQTDHAIGAGATSVTAPFIPDKAVVIGVSARVLTAVAGAAAWDLGVAGAPDRYGSGFGTAAGSFADGVTGQPQAYFGGTGLLLTAQGGSFAGGTVRLAVHYLGIVPPL